MVGWPEVPAITFDFSFHWPLHWPTINPDKRGLKIPKVVTPHNLVMRPLQFGKKIPRHCILKPDYRNLSRNKDEGACRIC